MSLGATVAPTVHRVNWSSAATSAIQNSEGGYRHRCWSARGMSSIERNVAMIVGIRWAQPATLTSW